MSTQTTERFPERQANEFGVTGRDEASADNIETALARNRAFAAASGHAGAVVFPSLERVMNSIRNGLGMRETEIAKAPSRPWNTHTYAVFAQVHNTL